MSTSTRGTTAQNLTDEQEARRLDGEAVVATLAGDLSAFDRLIERYQRRAVAVAYRLLGNIEDAMDVCQEAYVRAFRSLSTLEQPESVGAWLLRIVSNLSLNYRRGRRPTLSLAADDEGGGPAERLAEPAHRDGRTGGQSIQDAEMHAAVTAAIEALPEQQRLALVLFAVEQIPQKEVADILDCSVEMVKWNVFQARKKLKESLAEYLEE